MHFNSVGTGTVLLASIFIVLFEDLFTLLLQFLSTKANYTFAGAKLLFIIFFFSPSDFGLGEN